MEASRPALEVEVNKLGDSVAEVVVRGSLDWNTFREVDDALRDLLEAETYRIVVRLDEAKTVTSVGFGCFLAALDEARKSGGNLVFLKTPEPIKDVFRLLGMGDILQHVETVEDALQALGA